MGERVAIVGIGQTQHRRRRPDVSLGEMVNEAVRAALEDAGLTLKDMDAVLCSDMDFFEGDYLSNEMLADSVGSYLKPGLKVNTGGTTGGTAAIAGWYHVASGLFDTVLTVAYQKLDEPIASTACMITCYDPLYDRDFGTGAIGVLAQMALRYMATSGCSEEHGAMIRVKSDKNALRNPNAHLRLNISVEDVMNSRMVTYPLRLLHICPDSAGACALVLASEKKANKITNKPVWIKDHITVHRGYSALASAVSAIPSEQSHTVAARKLFARNGIANPRKELQTFEIYEPTSWAELEWLEDFMVCEKGEAWKLLEKGVWDLEGEFPVNPSGGVVCTNPIGATAMIRVAEAALQIRGDAGEHQATREVKRAIASSWGGSSWSILFLLTKSLYD